MANDWSRVIFSDESTSTTTQGQRVRVWRIRPTFSTSLTVGGRMSTFRAQSHSTAEVRCTASLKADVRTLYTGTLWTPALIPFVHSDFFPDHNFSFQQDLAPVQTVRVVKNHLQQCGIEKLGWVPKSADMNIIENVWGRIKVAKASLPKFQPKPALVCRANQLNSHGNNRTGIDRGDAPSVAGETSRSGGHVTLRGLEA
ncbi:hypothetical protein HPB47_012645 [Ixodes persulcatus]|uniref:Uncharacterized protein n=1 Tax=Ixodes persulcatus TaxID=34615 RepID=A0AC60NT31_IXOPE|nr:hypothetical protein HPB47_012645 [Ixodes persulcatus]